MLHYRQGHIAYVVRDSHILPAARLSTQRIGVCLVKTPFNTKKVSFTHFQRLTSTNFNTKKVSFTHFQRLTSTNFNTKKVSFTHFQRLTSTNNVDNLHRSAIVIWVDLHGGSETATRHMIMTSYDNYII